MRAAETAALHRPNLIFRNGLALLLLFASYRNKSTFVEGSREYGSEACPSLARWDILQRFYNFLSVSVV